MIYHAVNNEGFWIAFYRIALFNLPFQPLWERIDNWYFSFGFLSEFSIPRFGFYLLFWLVKPIALGTRLAYVQHNSFLLTSLPSGRRGRTTWLAPALSQLFLSYSTPNRAVSLPNEGCQFWPSSIVLSQHSVFSDGKFRYIGVKVAHGWQSWDGQASSGTGYYPVVDLLQEAHVQWILILGVSSFHRASLVPG